MRARYRTQEDYQDADRVVDAGVLCLMLTLLLPLLWLPATILGAIAVQKRRTGAGTLIMCIAPFAVAASLLMYAYLLFGSPGLDVFGDLLSPTTGEFESYAECMADPGTTYAECRIAFPGG